MSQAETWTIGRLLQWTTDFLKRHGSDSPRLDAEVLLAEALGCPRILLYTRFEEVPKDDVRTAFRDLVRRRSEGTPVAYLVGRREFFSLPFRVTPDVLIPRPETEFILLALFDLAKARPSSEPLTICDIGTGSGVLAVAAAKHLPQAAVVAIDRSAPALTVARENAAALGVAERIEFFESDLFAAVPQRTFDFVISNPPYVTEAEFAELSPDVRNYEPRGALVSGPLGTEVIARLIPQATERLRPGGSLLIEISPMIHEAVLALLAAEDRLVPGETVRDYSRQARVVQAQRK